MVFIKTGESEKIESFINFAIRRVPAVTAVSCFANEEIDSNLYAGLIDASRELPLEDKMRIFSYASIAATGEIRDLLEKTSLRCVREMIIEGTVGDAFFNFSPDIKHERTEINLPLRINWGGTWTDTPPYCLENGGAVVNAAVKINGVYPVKVILERLREPKVILEYFDSSYRREYEKIDDLSDFSDPLDLFLLLKSALAVCGLIPIPGLNPQPDVFKKLHGGIYLSAGVAGIPKGSGLGTSSILLTACIKGILDFLGLGIEDTDLYRRVLLAEQIMGTGGGWQDQAGGLSAGIKFSVSEPGYKQDLRCETLKVPELFLNQLHERFCLVYSGQRRIGRTILRQIMGGYIQSDPKFLNALNNIHSLAEIMKCNILSGNINCFINDLNRQTALTNILDTGYINDRINIIFDACKDMTDGKMICGAGGGGFIQIILKEEFAQKDLSSRLKKMFPNQNIDVWDCEFI